MYKLQTLIKALLVASLSLLVTGCGDGHHHGSSYVGAANVSITATPGRIDTGDRTSVKIKLSKVHEDGILLKVRYPSSLVYVHNSAYFKVDGSSYDTAPSFDVADGYSVKSNHYLVFFFDKEDFGRSNKGELAFELQGVSSNKDARIAVDPDVNDRNIPDELEFDVNAPEFETEDRAIVTVVE